MKTVLIAVAIATLFTGCMKTQPKPSQELAYPYVSSAERQTQIRNGMGQIKKGMTPSQVDTILGKTDMVLDLFNRGMKDSKPIGYTWWYVLQRKTDKGSFAEREEKLVRISFDLKDRVTNVDFWGIDKPSDNKAINADK